MRTRTLVFVLLMLLGISSAFALEISPGWSYGYELGVTRGDNAGSRDNFAPMARAHLQLEIFRFLHTRVGLGYTPLHASKTYSTDTFMGDYRFIFTPFYREKFSPFAYVGAGATLELGDSDADVIPLFPFGIGAQTRLKPGMNLEVTLGYNLSNSDMLDGRVRADDDLNTFTNRKQDGFYSLTVGLAFSDPGPKPKPKPAPAAPPIVKEKPVEKPIERQAPPVVTPPVEKPAPPIEREKPPVVTPPVEVPAPPIERPAPDLKTMDSDGDGLSDWDEINVYKTDSNKPDTDGDGLNDFAEVMTYKTNPLLKDTDGDGLDDYAEVMTHKTNPLVKDTDGDGLNDGDEVLIHKTDPLKPDTDGDGLSDGDEVLIHKTNPLNVDTDGDGLNDMEEVVKYLTNPLVKDTDGGTVNDGDEVAAGTNPLDPKDDVLDLTVGSSFSLEGILFETGKSNILPQSVPILEQAYAALAANPTVKIHIIGHTDNVGSASSNQTLSENRAKAVRDWLVNKGIAANRIRTSGKGESQPRATNDTPEGRTLNRRIEFEVE